MTTTTTTTITTCSHLSNKHQGLLFSRLSRPSSARLLFFLLVFFLCLLSSCSNQAQAQDQSQDQSQDQAQTQAQESTAGTTLNDFTCDLLNDKCPTQRNSICESSFAETPAQTSTDPACLNDNNNNINGGGGDCLDCNALTCGQYDYDCLGCLTATVGCFWCPGDATCNNSPYYIFSVSTSCSPPSSLNASVEEGGYVASPKTADYCNASTFNKNNNDSDTTETIMFSDPLLPAQQWIFDQINVLPVWQEKNITGQGVRIRINDDGVDGSILELQNKLDVEASCELYAPILTRRTLSSSSSSSRRTLSSSSRRTSSSSLSSPVLEYNPNQNQITNGQFGHGTIVASIVGGHANNGQCGVGIAPDVMLSSCNVFAVASTTTTTTTTFVEFATKVDQFDISQNSIGVQACSLLKEAAENNNQGRRNRRGRRRQRRDLQVDGRGGTAAAGEGGGVEDDATNCPFEALDAEPCAVCNFTLPTSTSTTPTTTTTPACAQSIVSYCEQNFYRDEFACLDFLDLLIGPNRQCDYNRIPDIMLEAITDGIMQGRNGKGIIYVFASGNDNRIGDDVNFGGLTNSRLTVTVGAVGKDGLHASYSTTGAALLVTAPGGDSENISNHVAALQGGGCSANLQGTSFAAPVVSGVIALMLQANPDLSWRDVQGILAQTSKMPVPGADTNDDTRVTNGAGLVHSNKYGFGIINANDAVEAAQNWDFYCPEQFLQAESGLVNLIITDDSSTTPPISSIITVDANTTTTTTAEDVNVDGFIVESVVVLLDVLHFSRGDLEVRLVSPSGTTSLLSPGPRPENTQHDEEERWKLMTVRNWGESPVGDWTLSIRDVRVGHLTTCVDAPFRAQYQGLEIDCQYLSTEGLCANGSPDATTIANNLLTLQVEGFTIEDACCDCGGGFSTTDFEDRLIQWRLVVYGRTEICEGKNSTMTTTTRGSDPPSSTPSESPTPKATTTATKEAPTKNQEEEEEEEPEAEKDPKERTATIVASVVAFVLSFAFIYAVLREPSSSSKNRCFGNRSGVNGDHATSNGESGPLFQPVEGGMKNIV